MTGAPDPVGARPTPTNPSQALALVLVDELARGGVTHAVLAPGSRSAPLAMALHDEPRIRLHVEIDERSAAFLALGAARAGRSPAVVLSTSGTAAANFHPAVAEADRARVPLLVLTADRPPELRGTGANQTIDQLRLYGPAVRAFAEIGPPEPRAEQVGYWRSVAARAVATAGGRPPGPVHLNVALREPLVPHPDERGFPHRLDGRAGGRPWVVADRPPRPPSPEQVDALAELVVSHERGMVIAGDVDTDPGPVVALAEAARWPLLAEPQSGARAGPHAVSTYATLLAGPDFAAAHRPSAAVVVGKVGLSRPLLALLGPDVEQVLVDPDGLHWDPRRAVSRVVAADPAPVCAALAAALPARPPSAWLRAWLDAEARARTVMDEVLDAAEAPSEPRTARDLAALAPDGATLTVANSMPVRDLDRVMRPRHGLRVLANRGASGIDGFVSTALGVALATPGPALALAGDLSVLHDQNGLLLRGESVDCVLVVVNNDGGGIFSFLPQADFAAGFERLFGTPHGVDFARLAAVHGVGHRLVSRAADLPAAVSAAGERGGVQLVEVRTDRADNRALHRSLNERVAVALRA